MKKFISLILVLVVILTGCSGKKVTETNGEIVEPVLDDKVVVEDATVEPTDETTVEPEIEAKFYEEFSDVRKVTYNDNPSTLEVGEYNPESIINFIFNEGTVFRGSEELAKTILENGKNPGLGIRALHEQSITGKGVNVAIIDQHLANPYHHEYAENIIDYFDTGTGMPTKEGSMHGPAVASLLVGKSCGVAPDAGLYYAAAPSWYLDSAYYADALNWIIEKNRELPEGQKIRIVSISGAPSGTLTIFTKNTEQWDEAVALAQAEGILVIDCRQDCDTGFVGSGYYDPYAPEDVTRFTPGFPGLDDFDYKSEYYIDAIFVPASYRTLAEHDFANYESFQYNGRGGQSWSIPYVAGVLALGFQVDPTLTNEEIVKLLFESAYVNEEGIRIINPPAFIEAIKDSK